MKSIDVKEMKQILGGMNKTELAMKLAKKKVEEDAEPESQSDVNDNE